ncbi:hypothetical protein G9A89_006767 [Geosiphon pyriformis]|nr:hypothetical protein G9A89_006767 [Geosiphon pyriformis]
MSTTPLPYSPRRFTGKGEQSIFLGSMMEGKLSLMDKNYDNRTIWLLLIAPIWTLLFTAIPVIVKFQGIWADLYRFTEPLVGLTLMYFILSSAEIFSDRLEHTRKYFGLIPEQVFSKFLFMIGAAIYGQGAGMHSTAVLAKHKIKDIIIKHPEIISQYPEVQDAYTFLRTDLEHVIGHYLYAGGAVLITWSHLLAFRRQRHDAIENTLSLIPFILGSIAYAILLTGVAINFPKGTIVGLVYVLVIGTPLVIYLLRSGHLFSKGRRLVLQSYSFGYILSLVFILIWIGVNKGFKDREDSDLFSS